MGLGAGRHNRDRDQSGQHGEKGFPEEVTLRYLRHGEKFKQMKKRKCSRLGK